MITSANTTGTWSNWTGSRSVAVLREVFATDESDVVAAVARARDEGVALRAVGTGYSWGEAVGHGAVVVRTEGLRGVRNVDLRLGTARIAAGTPLQDVCRELRDVGMELPTIGGFSGQSIAGAIATATHGTGVRQKSLSAYATGFRIVDASGQMRDVGEGCSETLRAARVAIGALGIVTEVEMQVQPATWLRTEDSWHAQFDPSWLSADDGIRRAVRWHPNGYGAPGGSWFQLREWIPARAEHDGAHPSHVALATAGAIRPHNFTVTEHAVPVTRADEVMDAVARALDRAPGVLTGMPLALRVVAPDDAHLSPYRGSEAMITLSAAAHSAKAGVALFRLVHDVVAPFHAKPHWAKEHFYSQTMLEDRFPGLQDFEAVRRNFDPRGMFLTPSMRELLTGHMEDQCEVEGRVRAQ
ncbi:D-arabinono-1,4-lactone oxidase [Microbacterium sp. A588]